MTLTKKQQNILLFFITGITVFMLFRYFYSLSPFIYFTNDDVFFDSIASGEMTGTPNPRLYYIGFPAGFIISTLYNLIPSMPWYGLFLCVSFGITMWVVLYKLMTLTQSIWGKILLLILFAIGSYSFLFLHIAEIQFTTVTGMVGAGAVFLFFLSDVNDSIGKSFKNYSGFFLLSAYSLCIRDKGFLMLLPFIGILGIAKLIDADNKEKRKNLFILAGAFLAMMVLIMGFEKLAYSREDWKEFSDYTSASETIYDYTGYPEYDTYEDVYKELGLTRSSYEAAAHHYNIVLEPLINKQTMETLEEIAEEEIALTPSKLPGKLKEMVHAFIDRHISYTDRPLNLLVYSIYILFFVASFVSRKKTAARDIFLVGIARMFIWAYLLYYGRLPARVSQAVYLAELVLLLGIAWKYRIWSIDKSSATASQRADSFLTREKYAIIFWTISVSCLVFIMFRFGMPKAEAAKYEANGRLTFSSAFTDIKNYFKEHPENFYYLDMNSFGSFTEDALQGHKDEYGNFLFMGSWVPHSPWYSEKFIRQGILEEDAAKAVFEDNVYLVFMKTDNTGYDYLVDFYNENYPGVTIEVVEEVTVSNDVTFQILKGYQ